MDALDELFAEAAARGGLRRLSIQPIGAPDRRMWQVGGSYHGSDGYRVAIQATPTEALAEVLRSLIRTEGKDDPITPAAAPPPAPDFSVFD